MPLYLEDLPKKCSHPNCDCDQGPLYIHGRCHVDGRLEVYVEDGVIYVGCMECSRPIASFHLASRPPESREDES